MSCRRWFSAIHSYSPERHWPLCGADRRRPSDHQQNGLRLQRASDTATNIRQARDPQRRKARAKLCMPPNFLPCCVLSLADFVFFCSSLRLRCKPRLSSLKSLSKADRLMGWTFVDSGYRSTAIHGGLEETTHRKMPSIWDTCWGRSSTRIWSTLRLTLI